jgi:hypothetical protein
LGFLSGFCIFCRLLLSAAAVAVTVLRAELPLPCCVFSLEA